jgi:hypothetical protein
MRQPQSKSRQGEQTLLWHSGGCHCGAVRFEVEAPAEIEAISCNCSICRMTGFLHLIATKAQFRLLQGSANLTTYSFNTGTAKHLFCKTCGIKSFYIPRSHPDGYSINVNCLNRASIKSINITPFDGENWESSIESIR